MKSLRLRLALLSTAISGVVIAVFGVVGWMTTAKILRESIDLQIAAPLDRVVRDLHPRTDLQRVIANLEIGFGDEVEAGTRRLLLLDRDGYELQRAPDDDWVAEIDPGLLKARAWQGRMETIIARGDGGETGEGSGDGELSDAEWERFLGGFGSASDRPPPRRDEGRPSPRTPEEPFVGDGKKGGLPSGKGALESGGPPRISFFTFEDDGKSWRAGVIEDRGYIVLMASELSAYHAEVGRVRRLFLLAFPLGLVVIGFGGWVVARRALRPVDRIASTASRVTARGLDQRIPRGVADYRELSHLVDVLNGMMDRLETSFQHAMRFSSDVSHELKTPLAVMQVAVQDAIKACPPGSPEEESLLTVSQEADRLKRITRSLMLLAQADAGQIQMRYETLSLSREVEAVCEDAEILCEKAALAFKANIEPSLEVRTDAVLLRQAMQNLVSNAIKYNHRDGRVVCRLFRVEGAAEVVFEVANTGPAIDEADEERIFERFYRVDPSRSREVDGFGLGLNLAREIVRAMGGELLLAESNAAITRFQIRLKAGGKASDDG